MRFIAEQTYVRVTANGSPSGTATTTMVTYKIVLIFISEQSEIINITNLLKRIAHTATVMTFITSFIASPILVFPAVN